MTGSGGNRPFRRVGIYCGRNWDRSPSTKLGSDLLQERSCMSGARRVVVTGTGVVSPIGNDVPSFWSAMKESRCGVGPIKNIDFPDQYVRELHIQIACQVRDFDPKARLKNRLLLMADRYSLFAAAAASEAMAQS